MRAIIVEDHPEIAEELATLIGRHCPGIHLRGTASSVVTAAKLAIEVDPDLIFLDVELPDGTGFDLLDILERPVKVIFITGSDAHAIRAFRYAAIDYLLKPVDSNDLIDAVNRARSETELDGDRLAIYRTSVRNAEKIPERIALHTSDKIHFVRTDDIVRCMADGNYTRFYFLGNHSLLVAKTLKDYDKLLSGADFLRVHQSHLVNLKHVKEYVKTDGGFLVLDDGMKIPVSTRKKAEVMDRFDDIAHA